MSRLPFRTVGGKESPAVEKSTGRVLQIEADSGPLRTRRRSLAPQRRGPRAFAAVKGGMQVHSAS